MTSRALAAWSDMKEEPGGKERSLTRAEEALIGRALEEDMA
jgi:hypothetical protein